MADGRAVPDAGSYGEDLEVSSGLSRASLGRDRYPIAEEMVLLRSIRVQQQRVLWQTGVITLPINLDTTTSP